MHYVLQWKYLTQASSVTSELSDWLGGLTFDGRDYGKGSDSEL